MTITAKFSSICPCCNGRIEAGTKVEWSKGSKARHITCAQQPFAASTPSRSYYRGGPTGARRRAPGAGTAANVPGYSSWCTGREGCGCFDCAS